jgi:hypothetical protein
MMAVPAGAVTGFPLTDANNGQTYGFDGHPHVIVGGGSDTTYAAQLAISQLWMRSSLAGCGPLHNAGSANAGGQNTIINECVSNTNSDLNLGNYQGDTVAQANPAGSGAGMRSLVGYDGKTGGGNPSPTSYEGTVNPITQATDNCITNDPNPNVDFARSSAGANTSGSNRVPATCGGNGDDYAAMTFWGFARDAITFIGFNNRASELRSSTFIATGGITPTDMRKIYDCTYTMWSQVPGLSSVPGFVDGPIVPWTMNNASGTRATGTTFLTTNTGANAAWVGATSGNFPVFDQNLGSASGAGTGPCTQYLGTSTAFGNSSDVNSKPLENDTKQLVHNFDTAGLPGDPAGGLGLSSNPNSKQDPDNWIWFGSFGVFNAFSFTSKVTTGIVNNANNGANQITSVQAGFLPISGIIPSPNRVFADTVGANLGRTLFHVTRKSDADCPTVVQNGHTVCDFDQGGTAFGPHIPLSTGTNHDLQVVGQTSGISGAVREYTRFMCRTNNDPNFPTNVEQGLDPLTGTSYDTLLSNAITAAGFTTLNGSLASPGSRCQVLTAP